MANRENKPVIIGVTGGSGSGKTTVSRAIFEQLHGHSLLMLQEDSYYNDQSDMPFEERIKTNYDHPNAFDTELLVKQLKDLLDWKTIEKPIYDYTEHTRSSEVEKVEPKEVIILEGILVLNDPALRDLMDIKIFVDTDADIRFIRRLVRDVNQRGRSIDSVIEQYCTTVKPMHEQFVEYSKKNADIIVPEGGNNQVALNMIKEQIKNILSTL